MKLQFAAATLSLALASTAASAQGALYLNPVAIRVSNSTPDKNPTFSFLGVNSTSRMFYGVGFGGFYDLPQKDRPFELGIDLRDSIVHGNNALLNSFLIGPRFGFVPQGRSFHPYLEPVVGVGTSRAPNTALKVSKLEAGAFAGLDYDLSRHVGLRIFEIGYTNLITASGQTIGGSETYPSANLFHFSTGLTFRLP